MEPADAQAAGEPDVSAIPDTDQSTSTKPIVAGAADPVPAAAAEEKDRVGREIECEHPIFRSSRSLSKKAKR